MLSVVCLVSLFLLRDHPRLLALQRGATDAVALTAEVILAPVDGWNRLVQSFQSRAALQDEVFRLQQENRVLKGRTQRLVSLLSENARYKALLNSARDIEDELVAAQITSVSPDPARHLVMLDKGSIDGLREGQPVLGAEGLMGQIVMVGQHNSRAVLITDSAHALPVQVNRSGLRAIAEGSGRIDHLVIRHLAATTDIRVGDLLVTSGLGGRFPHGYPVARITDVTISPGDAFAEVNAAPSSALDRGRFVLVVVRESADSIQPGSQL
ncbi:rod shape-determining protein MreC [Luminiphilus sp.]|nr:rod shape-determining protein MreC [Luminiphilus sp.]